MTITLNPETETRLRARAEREQRDVSALADALLSEALDEDSDDLADSEVAEASAGAWQIARRVERSCWTGGRFVRVAISPPAG